MFFADARDEVPYPAAWKAMGVGSYRLVEQSLDTPLWYVQVLPAVQPDEDADTLLRLRFLFAYTNDVVSFIAAGQWQSVEMHMILPTNLTGKTAPVLGKCLAIWDSQLIQYPERSAWLMDTDEGSYVDPLDGGGFLRLDEVRRHTLCWQEASPMTAKRSQRAPKPE
jgi:hypothetical protein